MPEFAYTDLLPAGPDSTEYRLLTTDGITRREALGREFLEVAPDVLTLLAARPCGTSRTCCGRVTCGNCARSWMTRRPARTTSSSPAT